MPLALFTSFTVGLCIGLTIGIGFGIVLVWLTRRELVRKDEQMLMLEQEKIIVFDFVHNMVDAIADGITREALMEKVVHAAVLSTGAISACVFERRGDRLQGAAVEGLFPPHRPLPESIKAKIISRANFIEQVLKTEVFRVGEGLVGKVAHTGVGILIENALEDPQIIRHEDPALEVRSVIVVPINVGKRNLGVLAIVNPANGGSFGKSDYSLAESLAEQAGLAIYNLDLMAMQIEKKNLDVDLGLAQEIQSMLLPKVFPQVENLDMASIYRSAQKVGGDLYDFFMLAPMKVGVAIADVSGKGIPASLLMAICQSNLRHFAKNIDSPSGVLRELNNILLEEMRPEMFVTVIYAVIDMENDELVYARGGHELPILIDSSNEQESIRHLRGNGMALGMVPDEIFSQSIEDIRIPFKKGSVFTLFTDGVTEIENTYGKEFGSERLGSVISSLKSRPAKELAKGVLNRVTLYSGSDRQSDDFTLVVAKHL